MEGTDLDVVAVGHAIVDVLADAEDSNLEALGLVKGTMELVDADRADALYASMGPAIEVSGGSAANTAAGLASFGARAAFVGKVAQDQFGGVFTHDIRAVGVEYATPPAPDGPATGRCLVLVTPDAQRTMSTFLGAATLLGPGDIGADVVARARIAYVEGYLWDPPEASDAVRHTIGLARSAGRQVALSLSDPLCVERHRDEFLELVTGGAVDILFANELEALNLLEVDSFDEALAALSHSGGPDLVVAVTRGPLGSVVVGPGSVVQVAPDPVAHVVDTTGAGDLYAAGFLYGLVRGADLEQCGRLGSVAAAEVISHFGARPEVRLATLAQPVLG